MQDRMSISNHKTSVLQLQLSLKATQVMKGFRVAHEFRKAINRNYECKFKETSTLDINVKVSSEFMTSMDW